MDKQVTEHIFQVLGNAVTNQNHIISDDIDWLQVMWSLFDNGIGECCYRYVNQCLQDKGAALPDMEQWKRLTVVTILREEANTHALLKVLQGAAAKGIQVLVFKGVVLSQLYPEPAERGSDDSDLLVKPEDAPAMHELLVSLGYQSYPQKEHVQVYELEDTHIIELHTSLFEDYRGKTIRKLEQLNLTADETLTHITINNTDICTLGKTEHLFYIMFHLIKHFSLEGIGMRYMLDVTLYINRWGDEIDWNRFWTDCRLLKYDRFCRMFFFLCEKHLGMRNIMDEPGFTITEEEEQLLLDEFVYHQWSDELTEQGIAYEALHIVEPYFCNRKKQGTTKLRQKLSYYFPLSFYSDLRYQYANRCKLLIPVAWCHRAIDYRKKIKQLKQTTLKGKIEKAEQRIAMMKLTGLID